MRRRSWAASFTVIGGAILVACSAEPDLEPVAGKPVVVKPVEVRDLVERLEVSGELLAKNRAEVAAQVAGEITEVRFDEGDAVAADDVVLEIDPEKRELELERARAGVGEAQASVAEQRREVKRMSALAKTNIASQTQLDQANTKLETARARRAAAKADLGVAERALRDATVTARFAGFIARRYVSRGEFVQMGQRLFELVSLDPVELEFHLPEADTSRVRLGQPIEVTVAPYPEQVFRATVSTISPTIDRRTRTLRVRAVVPNPDGRLHPGLFARANLGIAERKGVLLVPEEAVQQRADGAIVFRVLPGNRAERRIVETGVVRDGKVEIRKGLSRGDAIASRGHADLIDGSLVEPRNPDGSPLSSVGAPMAESGEVTAQ